jgi:hypothetical protein
MGAYIVTGITDANAHTLALWNNGTLEGGPTFFTGSLSSTKSSTLFICGNNNGAGDAGQYDIGEILLYNRPLPVNERSAVEKYLSTKWNIPLNSSLPPLAVAFGFFNRVFVDDFDTISTIDINNTGARGYNWYTRNAWPKAFSKVSPTPPSAISVANSVLTLSNDVSGMGMGLTSICSDGGSGYVGSGLYSGGFFVRWRMSFDPALANAAFTSWPALWHESLHCFLVNDSFVEVDTFEAISKVAGTVQNSHAVHDWFPLGDRHSHNQVQFLASFGGADLNTMHEYGMINAPESKNGGLGLVAFYFDGELTQDSGGKQSVVRYSPEAGSNPFASPLNPNGTFSFLDTSPLALICGCGPNWPINIDRVEVYQ